MLPNQSRPLLNFFLKNNEIAKHLIFLSSKISNTFFNQPNNLGKNSKNQILKVFLEF